MKKILMILTLSMTGIAHANNSIIEKENSLLQAVRSLKVEKVSELLTNSKLSAKEGHALIDELNIIIESFANKPWYKRTGSLVKIGIGVPTLFFAGRYLIDAVRHDPRGDESRRYRFWKFISNSAWIDRLKLRVANAPAYSGLEMDIPGLPDLTLCIISGALTTLSLQQLYSGIHGLFTNQKKENLTKALAIKGLIYESMRNPEKALNS